MKEVWTIRKIVAWTTAWFRQHGIESPRLDAELLLSNAMNCTRIDLYLEPDKPLSDDEKIRFRTLVKRRALREPLAYILGFKEFYGRNFAVDSRVLIPRPETETLIDVALMKMRSGCAGKIADLGTGSGCIAISLAMESPGTEVVGTDVSGDALEVAKNNVSNYGLNDRVALCQGSWYDALQTAIQPESLDCVVSNPPYIPEGEVSILQPEISRYEPALALDGGRNGMNGFLALVNHADCWLKSGGWIIMEIGNNQAGLVRETLEKASFDSIEVTRDPGGWERVVSGRKNGS